MPGAQDFTSNNLLAHPFSALAQRPRHPRQHRLFRASASHTAGNAYILLFTDRFSLRTDMYAVTEAQSTASGTMDVLMNHSIPLSGCSVTLLSDNGLQFCLKNARAVYERLAINKIPTSAYHSSNNGGVERVNHTMALMLAMSGNEQQTDWDIQLLHVESSYNNSVSAATGLAPNEVTWAASPDCPSPPSTSPTPVDIKVWTRTIKHTSTLPLPVSNAPSSPSVSSIRSPSGVLDAVTL